MQDSDRPDRQRPLAPVDALHPFDSLADAILAVYGRCAARSTVDGRRCRRWNGHHLDNRPPVAISQHALRLHDFTRPD